MIILAAQQGNGGNGTDAFQRQGLSILKGIGQRDPAGVFAPEGGVIYPGTGHGQGAAVQAQYRLAEKLRQPLRAGIAGAFHGAHGQGDGLRLRRLLGQLLVLIRLAQQKEQIAQYQRQHDAQPQKHLFDDLAPAGRLLRGRLLVGQRLLGRKRVAGLFFLQLRLLGFDLPGHILRPLVLILHVAPFRRFGPVSPKRRPSKRPAGPAPAAAIPSGRPSGG